MNDFSAKVTLSSSRLSLLEPLTITLSLTYPKEYQPDLDTLRTHLTREFILLSEKILDPQTIQWTVTSQTPGKKIVTFYAIPFHAEGKETIEVISDLYPVEIYLPKVDLTYNGELAPLLTFSKTPLSLSQENIALEAPDHHAEKLAAKTFSPTALSLFLTLALFATLIYYLRSKIKAPPEEPTQAALGSLEEIESLPEEEYYEKMSTIVRQFIEDKYHINASSRTSQECLENLRIKKPQKELLQTFFHAVDQVNYAHHHPTTEERQATSAFAKKFIAEL